MSQMARQTADYDGDEPASCCSPSGIRISNKKEEEEEAYSDCEKDDDATNSTSSLSVPSSPSSFSGGDSSRSARSRKLDGRSLFASKQDDFRPDTMPTIV